MKLILPLLIVLMAWNAVAQPAPAIKRNSFTTNSDPAALGIVTNIAEALLNAPTNGVTALQATNIANALINNSSNVNWKAFPTFDWYSFGARVTNSTFDNDVAWTNMVSAWQANEGGTIRIPMSGDGVAGYTNSGWFIPDDDGRPQYHYPLRIIGGGSEHNWVFEPIGGTMVYFTGTNTNNAAIFLGGYGNVEISGINIMAAEGLENDWLLKAVYSRVHIHGNYFGGRGDGGTNSVTHALKFGNAVDGTGFNYTNANLPNANAQGYQTIIANNDFGNIATVIELNRSANHYVFRENGVNNNCGGIWPMIVVQTNASGITAGNSFLFNTFEGTGYFAPMVRLDRATYTRFLGNGWYDPIGTNVIGDVNFKQYVFEITNSAVVHIDENLIDQGFTEWLHGPPQTSGQEWRTFVGGKTNYYNNYWRHGEDVILAGNSELRMRSGTDQEPTDFKFNRNSSSLFLYHQLPGADAEQAARFNRNASNQWSMVLGPVGGTTSKFIGGTNVNLLSAGPAGNSGDISIGWNATLPDNFLRFSPLGNGRTYWKGSNLLMNLPLGARISWSQSPDPTDTIRVGLLGTNGEVHTVSGTGTTLGTNRAATSYANRVRVLTSLHVSTNLFPDPIEDGIAQHWFNPADTNYYLVIPDGGGGSNLFLLTTEGNAIVGYLKDKDDSATNITFHPVSSGNAWTVIGQAGGISFANNTGWLVVSNSRLATIGGQIDFMDSVANSNRTVLSANNNGLSWNVIPFSDGTNFLGMRLTKIDGVTAQLIIGGPTDSTVLGTSRLNLQSAPGSNVRLGTSTNATFVTVSPKRDVGGVVGSTNSGPFMAADYYSGDGTQGATATTGGATFKDGLYTGGTITGGGGAVNEPAVRVWQATYDATLDVESTNAYTFTSSTNFTVTLSGTAVDGQSVLFSVSNSHATANLTMTISPSVYDAVSKSTISTELVSSNAVSHYEFRFMTNFIGGGRWEFIRLAVPQWTLAWGNNLSANTNGANGSISVDVATLLSNLTAVKYAVHIPPVTASNILVTAVTNVHELVGLTNVVLTNIVEQATGASGSVEVHIRNTQSGSIPVVLPAFGAQHGYYFHTNGLNDVLSASIAPPGTNTVWSMRVVGTNVYPSVTYWRHP